MRRHRIGAGIALLLAGALALGGCGATTAGQGAKNVVVGSANFTESQIIASLYSQALQHAGYKVQEKFNIGSREVYVPALEKGDINVIPEYSGSLLRYLDKSSDASTVDAELDELKAPLADKKLKALKAAPAEDKDSLVVTKQTADKWNLKNIDDLAAHNDEFTLGAPPEYQKRNLPGLDQLYGVKPSKFVPLSDYGGPATVTALKDGDVLGVDLFSTNPAIKQNGFVVLKDTKGLFPADNVVPIVSESVTDDKLEKTLNGISEKLTTEELLNLNAEVSGDKKTEPSVAAKQWLEDKKLI